MGNEFSSCRRMGGDEKFWCGLKKKSALQFKQPCPKMEGNHKHRSNIVATKNEQTDTITVLEASWPSSRAKCLPGHLRYTGVNDYVSQLSTCGPITLDTF